MDYHVIIEPSGSEKIEFFPAANADGADDKNVSQGGITSFTFKMNSLNDNAIERDQHARCEMTLTGEINEDNREKTGKLAEWAMRSQNLYAVVTVEVTAHNETEKGVTMRSYMFDKMFCVDYEEVYEGGGTSSGSDTGKFTLFMAQGPRYKQRVVAPM